MEVIPNSKEYNIILLNRILHGIDTINCPIFVIFKSEQVYFVGFDDDVILDELCVDDEVDF